VTINDFFASSMRGSLEMLKMHLNDMTDAELMQRPVPGANTANWQIGHLIASEVFLVSKAGGKTAELPAGFIEKYSKETNKSDDPSRFATKAELIATFEKVREGTIAWAKSLTPAQLQAPSPMPKMFPTMADLANLANLHIAMHVGQIQVLRRKLGKPVLF
jgi:hypothetical protein